VRALLLMQVTAVPQWVYNLAPNYLDADVAVVNPFPVDAPAVLDGIVKEGIAILTKGEAIEAKGAGGIAELVAWLDGREAGGGEAG